MPPTQLKVRWEGQPVIHSLPNPHCIKAYKHIDLNFKKHNGQIQLGQLW